MRNSKLDALKKIMLVDKVAEVTSTVTMQDVARYVGVSSMTVSRVLNGTGRISPTVRQTVQQAIDELGYRPHLAPRMMKSRKSWQVGALLENRPKRRYTHPLAWEFVLGINEGLEEGGHMMSLMRMTDVAKDGGLQARALQSQLLDGVIVVNHIPSEVEERLEQLLPRCVWLDANVWREERCIRRDEEHAGEAVVRGLVGLGYHHLVLLHSEEETIQHYSGGQRISGVRRAARESDIQLQEIIAEGWSGSWLEQLPSLLNPEVALIVPDTYLAHALMMFAAQSRLQIGVDFAMACCDDHFHEGYQWEQVSRVSFDRFDMGRRAAEMMLQMLHAPDRACPSQVVRGHWQAGDTARLRATDYSISGAPHCGGI